jgi:hypothetical protein
MRDVVVRWRYAVACAIVLSVVVTADARDAARVRTPDADAGPRVVAAEREARERTLPRIIRRVVKSLTDGLIGPRP